MRDIYLIDFENVASEGLSGITYLAPEDEVIIFYSNQFQEPEHENAYPHWKKRLQAGLF